MSLETENVPSNPDSTPAEKEPEVREDACVLQSRSPIAVATEDFLEHEKGPKSPEPITPQNSESEEPQDQEVKEEVAPSPEIVEEEEEVAPPPQVIEVVQTVAVEELNGHTSPEPAAPIEEAAPVNEEPLTNGKSNGECKFEARSEEEEEEEVDDHKPKVLNGTIATELIQEDYKLPDVVEVKKNFEHVASLGNNVHSQAPPKKGALSTNIDSASVRKAYQDVRSDGSETQWAVFKFEGPTIVTSAKGSDFAQFKSQFGDDERAFGYIRVQTGDEMSKRAKFLFVTWIGPSVSILKRAKMSTDKAVIKDVLSNFAVELQTENISEINLQNFESELDKAAGAHYGTGVRS